MIKIYSLYVLVTLSIFSIAITSLQTHAVEEIWEDYENMDDMVKDIRNGGKDDDKVDYEKFKDSSVYKNADEDLRDCIDLANKVGEKLGDYEIVRCFENTNYYREKYTDNEGTKNMEEANQQEQNKQEQAEQDNQNQTLSEAMANTSQQQQQQQGQEHEEQESDNQNQTLSEAEEDSAQTQSSQSNSSSQEGCDSSYPEICITTYSATLSCGDIPFRNFKVLLPDPHGFDSDGDGIGCEG